MSVSSQCQAVRSLLQEGAAKSLSSTTGPPAKFEQVGSVGGGMGA